MSDTHLSKLIISKADEAATPDKISTGALSRWLETDSARLRIVTYLSGYEADHVCYDGHSFYVLEGNIKIELGEEISNWSEGDAFIIPDKVPHRLLNPHKSNAKIIVVDNG